MAQVENCASCVFWSNQIGDCGTGQCRRRSPAGPFYYKDYSGTFMGDIWPHTGPSDYCGDWELKDAQ